jgi:hypothetical protein
VYGGRWEALFADLEAEAEAEQEAERRSEVAERTRAEFARLRLIDRLRPALDSGDTLRLGLRGHAPVNGSLSALGVDWLLLTGPAKQDLLVALAGVQWLQELHRQSAEPGWEGKVGARLGLRVALRRIVRDRALVTVALSSGDVLAGRLARVGADHVELELENDGPPPSRAAISTIALDALVFVRRR